MTVLILFLLQQSKTMIPAHDSPLAALAFSPNGSRLATASEKGTVIRVFNVADGTRLFEFRRGVKRCVHISTLAFSTDANYLAASSNTETVHIFKLDEPQDVLSVVLFYYLQLNIYVHILFHSSYCQCSVL